jgi:enterochelin esterase-like enzyme
MHASERLRGFPGFAAGVAALTAFLAVGLVGVRAYGLGYWLYRGFAPPKDPAYVHVGGTTQQLAIRSPALGGRKQQVIVYLPPGYATSGRRYPVIYLLHGFPGRPLAFIETVRMGVAVDTAAARNPRNAAILVMPFGSTGTFTDKEWANGWQPHQAWATFVSRDVVHAIDARFRTIASRRGRAIAGLSEGGYGAINIALQHPTEFRLVESWSGYQQADPVPSIFGGRRALLRANSPLDTLAAQAAALRRRHAFVWFYSGSGDRFLPQNRAFAAELAHAGVAHRFFVVRGGHDWALWRANAARAYLAASKHLGPPRA